MTAYLLHHSWINIFIGKHQCCLILGQKAHLIVYIFECHTLEAYMNALLLYFDCCLVVGDTFIWSFHLLSNKFFHLLSNTTILIMTS